MILPLSPADRPATSLAKTMATIFPCASLILTGLVPAIMVYLPAGKIFPEMENLNGTRDWTPPAWAFAGITASVSAEQRLATNSICFFMKFLLCFAPARLVLPAVGRFLRRTCPLLHSAIRHNNGWLRI